MTLALIDGANDAVTAVLALAVGSVLRVVWSMQQRITRLEALDEYRERILDSDRQQPETETETGKERK